MKRVRLFRRDDRDAVGVPARGRGRDLAWSLVGLPVSRQPQGYAAREQPVDVGQGSASAVRVAS